jgi:hypothetical protein
MTDWWKRAVEVAPDGTATYRAEHIPSGHGLYFYGAPDGWCYACGRKMAAAGAGWKCETRNCPNAPAPRARRKKVTA